MLGKNDQKNRGNQRLKKDEIKEFVKRKKIYSLLLHLPSLTELGDLLKTSAKLGTQPEDIVRYFKKTGFKVRVRDEASWQDLKNALKNDKMVIVDWWTDFGDPGEDLGHYSVVTRISSKTMTIFDPDINKKRVLGKKTFLERWHDVHADGTTILNWMCEVGI